MSSFDLQTSEAPQEKGRVDSVVSYKKFVIGIVTAAILALILGVLIGNVTVTNKTGSELKVTVERLKFYESLVSSNDVNFNQILMDEISAQHIKSFLR